MAQNNISLREDLIWQIEAGIDECVGDMPIDRFEKAPDNFINTSQAVKSNSTQPLQKPPQNYGSAPERAILSAVTKAEATNSILDLRTAVENFEDCALKKTAINTVFSDGSPSAKIMFIGTVPGADEDRNGVPFSGLNGLLLDKILASIDLDRSSCYLTNIIFWRPPGDREPTLDEIGVCIPFVERHIELVLPDIIVLLGGPTSKILLGMKEGIMKIHGQFFEYSTSKMATPILAVPLYHPINLLSSPAYKQEVWRDLLKIREYLIQKSQL
jgi:DNA polymerase